MKSSKIENIFNYQPPLEDSKTFSSLTYCQSLQSGFEAGFAIQQPKLTTWQNPPLTNKWNQGGEIFGSNVQVSGEGGILSSWGSENRGFGAESSGHVKSSFSSTSSASAWGGSGGGGGGPEPRSLFSSTWSSNPPSFRPLFSSHEEGHSSKYLLSGSSGLGVPSQFLPKTEASVNSLNSRFGSPVGPLYNARSSSLGPSTYYPLMLGPLGRNIGPSAFRPGHNRPMMCNFCKNNKEVPDIYLNHYLYDPDTKVLSCPVLRKHVCEICGGTGDQAHTLQYCPVNREKGFQSKVPVLLKTRTITNSTGKIRRN